jgi:hypothetical protein
VWKRTFFCFSEASATLHEHLHKFLFIGNINLPQKRFCVTLNIFIGVQLTEICSRSTTHAHTEGIILFPLHTCFGNGTLILPYIYIAYLVFLTAISLALLNEWCCRVPLNSVHCIVFKQCAESKAGQQIHLVLTSTSLIRINLECPVFERPEFMTV